MAASAYGESFVFADRLLVRHFTDLFKSNSPFCAICGAWGVRLPPLCGYCFPRVRSLVPDRPFERRLASSPRVLSLFLWSTQGPLVFRKLARSLKISTERDWSLWVEWFCERIILPRSAVLVPAPAKRWGARDHAWYLARAFSQKTGFPVRNVLARSSRVEQKTLSGVARRSNRVELIDPTWECSDYRSVIIVDDIVTTGGTISACFEALGRPPGAQAWTLLDRAPCDVSTPLV